MAARFIGFGAERLHAYLSALPAGITVVVDGGCDGDYPSLTFIDSHERSTDVFIAGTGEAVAAIYSDVELQLARSAAVNFVDGEATIGIRSRHSHYTTRHNICGQNTPWTMTNTSEPHADDMALHAANPIDFDWMVKGVWSAACQA